MDKKEFQSTVLSFITQQRAFILEQKTLILEQNTFIVEKKTFIAEQKIVNQSTNFDFYCFIAMF